MAGEHGHAADPADRRHRRWRQRQVARGLRPHLRAAQPGLGRRRRATSPRCRSSRSRSARSPVSAPRGSSPATSRSVCAASRRSSSPVPPSSRPAWARASTRRQLGGIDVVARAGTVDVVVDTEDEAFALTRRILSYLPANTGVLPTRTDTDRRPAAPRARRCATLCRATDGRRTTSVAVLTEVFDADSVVELGRMFGRSTVTRSPASTAGRSRWWPATRGSTAAG